MALVSSNTDRFLEQYNKLKMEPDKKYNTYLAKLKSKNSPRAKTLVQAFRLLSRSRDTTVKNMFKGLLKRRTVILFDDLGTNRGWLYRPGLRGKDGIERDGVILIDSKYVDSAICAVGVLAHEYKHIKDREQRVSGIFATPDAEALQDRADKYAGEILTKLGAAPHLPGKLSPEQIAKLKERWGKKWSLWYNDMNHKMNLAKPSEPKKKGKYAEHHSTATHCNGNNHSPDCTCGWGGPH